MECPSINNLKLDTYGQRAMQEIAESHMHGWIDSSWSESKQKKQSQTTINQAKKIKREL